MIRNAKKRIAEALLNLMEEKTLQEISIGELCQKCGIARTTYYYHYQNMEETLEAVFADAIDEMMKKGNTETAWSERILELLKWMKAHPSVCSNLQDSVKIQQLNTIAQKGFMSGIRLRMSHTEDSYRLTKEQKDFIVSCSIHSLIAELLAWANTGMIMEPEEFLENLLTAYDGFTERAMQNFDKKNREAE